MATDYFVIDCYPQSISNHTFLYFIHVGSQNFVYPAIALIASWREIYAICELYYVSKV